MPKPKSRFQVVRPKNVPVPGGSQIKLSTTHCEQGAVTDHLKTLCPNNFLAAGHVEQVETFEQKAQVGDHMAVQLSLVEVMVSRVPDPK